MDRGCRFHLCFSPLIIHFDLERIVMAGAGCSQAKPRTLRFAKPELKSKACFICRLYASMIATARVQPAEARSIFTGKHDMVNPVDGRSSKLCSFSRWQ